MSEHVYVPGTLSRAVRIYIHRPRGQRVHVALPFKAGMSLLMLHKPSPEFVIGTGSEEGAMAIHVWVNSTHAADGREIAVHRPIGAYLLDDLNRRGLGESFGWGHSSDL